MGKDEGLEKLALLIADPSEPVLLRGEIWIVPEVLAAVGFGQGPKGLVGLASMMGADICFFPCSNQSTLSDFKEVVELSHGAGMGCGVILNGPFQQISQEKGLLCILEELGKKPMRLQSQLTKVTEKIIEILRLTEGLGIDLILIGDDLAYSGGLYFSPAPFLDLLLPLYRILVREISKTKSVLGWHSDGDVSPILHDIVNCGFRFFSLESECVNLLNFKRTYGNRVTLIGGIRAAWLTEKVPDFATHKDYLEEIKTLTREGGLILASSCGLHHPKFLLTLKEVYRLVESDEDSVS
jgi:uroporphyrinogen decarboxylase